MPGEVQKGNEGGGANAETAERGEERREEEKRRKERIYFLTRGDGIVVDREAVAGLTAVSAVLPRYEHPPHRFRSLLSNCCLPAGDRLHHHAQDRGRKGCAQG